MSLSAGTRLGPYEIVSAVGAGGMGEVYRARDTRLEREVAVKVLSRDLTSSQIARERFQREARTIAALHHPHICAIYDVGETPEHQAFIVIEFLQGETLEERLRKGPFDVSVLLETAIALAGALAAAHAAGIVHRDIKPANVFLTAWGPKLLDFGVAKTAPRVAVANSVTQTDAARPMLTAEGAAVGTLAYMSPEQLRGEEVDTRTDVFSLGLVLFQMATGRPAFAGATGAVVAAAILHEKPQTPSTLRPELTVRFDEIVLKALEKDQTLRYANAADLRADLQRLKRDTETGAIAAPAARTAAATPARRGRLLLAAAALLTIAAVAGGYVYSSYSRRPAPLTDKETVVLADFANTTGDPVFDDTLRQGLAIQLQQSTFLSLTSDTRIQQLLRLMGQPAGATLTPAIAREAVNPQLSFGYLNAAACHMFLDQLDEAAAALQRAADRKVSGPDFSRWHFHLAFLRGDDAAMEREFARAQGNGPEPELTHLKALALARSGQLEGAGSLARRAVDLSEKARQTELGALFQTAPAVWHALMGNVLEARQTAALALDMSTGRDVSYAAAFALALTGELARSQALLKDLEARFPQDTTVNISYLPALRGLIALQEGKLAEALQKLEPALSNEFALPGTAFFASFGSLYPAYVRGQTYLAAKRPADAAVEFRKIISRRGLVMEDPLDAVARLQLARALVASGDLPRARASYEEFLTLWKQADTDVPLLKQAQAEAAKLR